MTAPVTTPPYGGGNGTTQPYTSGYVGSYGNLPSGISNAGGPGGQNAYTGEVQNNGLVSNQLTGLLSGNSAYMQQAYGAGVDQANNRGLLNSGLAGQNAQAAAIQAGMPIAAADANSINSQQLANQASLNQILQQRMQDQTQLSTATTAAGASRYATDQNNRGALARQRENLAFTGEQNGLQRNFQQYMDNQGYMHTLGQDAFQLGGNMMLNNQNFRNQAGMQAMNNPFLLNDPNALGGYMDWIGGDFGNNIGDLLNFSFGLGG